MSPLSYRASEKREPLAFEPEHEYLLGLIEARVREGQIVERACRKIALVEGSEIYEGVSQMAHGLTRTCARERLVVVPWTT